MIVHFAMIIEMIITAAVIGYIYKHDTIFTNDIGKFVFFLIFMGSTILAVVKGNDSLMQYMIKRKSIWMTKKIREIKRNY